ncbi:MAG: transcription antitermination factor NusB [Pseudobutyrivibrio sp.]|uniref:transcription antitermination factor NusB n=1 Tax=Pseudobutyrivibrio sp. TaxID=2014367 RepID=UPI001B014222|nr:transcription antitermination factor NusB [Pseudobutyrivibrio sp.]MBO6282970.1 transcription antitermination factor NusB [Pseudobutyrivibrio sp.]MBP3260938.1 transcription antitermination factor NusB [Pseudobutyrivibrio sp.]MBQ3774297.1 transcription antitermination factor NusB [Pseudobutyrivibrio sp.]MBQ6463574.1 transcription antitermination factor NusB [Pseudobutyrivibrio sp.]
MNRHEIRKEVFKAVFMNEFYDSEEMNQVINTFLDGRDNAEEEDLLKNNKTEEDEAYIKSKAEDIISKLTEIDEMINKSVDGWKTTRMAKVDLTLIRLALYEIKFENLPVGVAINEAVSLADEFGTDSSAGFVNGALAKLV